MKFELNRLKSYSDEEIIKELQRVAKLLNASSLTGTAFEKESKVSRGTINRRFGGWKEALEAAGIGHLYSGVTVTNNMKEQKNRNITDEELLNELRSVANAVRRKDISCKDITQHSVINRDTFSRRFGSLEKAIKLAGLETREPGAARAIHTEENLFSNLYEIIRTLLYSILFAEIDDLFVSVFSGGHICRGIKSGKLEGLGNLNPIANKLPRIIFLNKLSHSKSLASSFCSECCLNSACFFTKSPNMSDKFFGGVSLSLFIFGLVVSYFCQFSQIL